MSLNPQITNRNKALGSKPLVCHPGLCSQGLRQVPVALTRQRRQNRLFLTRSKRKQVFHLGTYLAPLFPVAHSDTSANPLVNTRYGSVVVRDAKIIHPSSNIVFEFSKSVGHRDSPASTRKLSDSMPEVPVGLLGPTKFGSPESKSKKHAFVDLRYPALILVNHKLESFGQGPRQCCTPP